MRPKIELDGRKEWVKECGSSDDEFLSEIPSLVNLIKSSRHDLHNFLEELMCE